MAVEWSVIGFNQGGDSVVECVHENVGTNLIRAYMSWNIPGQKANRRLTVSRTKSHFIFSISITWITTNTLKISTLVSQNQNGITLLNSSYIDGTIYCNVLRDAVTKVEGVNFDLIRLKYFLLIAAGTSLKGMAPKYELANLNLRNLLGMSSLNMYISMMLKVPSLPLSIVQCIYARLTIKWRLFVWRMKKIKS